jgi:hypothetical protein
LVERLNQPLNLMHQMKRKKHLHYQIHLMINIVHLKIALPKSCLAIFELCYNSFVVFFSITSTKLESITHTKLEDKFINILDVQGL